MLINDRYLSVLSERGKYTTCSSQRGMGGGHTQQGDQGMLCTERRPALLPLVIYVGSDSLDPSHILQVVTA